MVSLLNSLILISIFKLFVFANVSFVTPIKTFIQLLNFPVQVTVLVGWSFETRYEFFNAFNQPISNQTRSYQLRISSDTVHNLPVSLEEFHQLIVIDLNCITTVSFLNEVSEISHQKFKWLAISPNETFFETSFNDFPLLVDSEVYCMLSSKREYLIKEVHRKSPNSHMNFVTIGEFYNDTGYIENLSKVYTTVQRRKNLFGTILRASMVVTNNETLQHLQDYKDKHIDTISKVNYILTCYLMEYLNATVNYKFVNQWGYLDNLTEIWSGMIGDLVENRSDIGATALFFTSDRVKYIDYIAMPTPTLSKFVFRSPKLSYTDDVFLLPFDKFVWYCLIAVFIVSTLALVGTIIVEWNLLNRENEISDASILKPSFHDTLILVLAATCQQGSAVAPKSFTARIVMVVTYITLMFLYTSYSANIVALLQSPSTKIQTLEDLLHSRLKFGADDTVFNRYYFVHASEPIRRQIYEQKIVQKNGSANFMSLAEGVERIRHGLFAFHMELGVGYKIMSETYMEHEKCGLQEIQYLQVIDPWYAIQKNSSYKELLKTGMMLLHEYGLQDRENNRLYTKRPQCASGGGKFVTASLVDIQSALLLLLYGYFAAIGILILEKLIHTSCRVQTVM